MAAVVFSGNVVKTLKDGIKLGSGTTVFTGAVDPSSVATTGAAGDKYISTSTNLTYIKQDAGSTVNWVPQVTTTGTQTLSNKTLTSTTTTFQSPGGTNRKLVVEVLASDNTTTTLSANQTADRTITLPNATTTLLGHNNTATVDNKTLSLATNTITSTASRVAVFNGSGNLAADSAVTTTELAFLDGVIPPTSFSPNNAQGTAADVTGLAFANGAIRSFEALVSVHIDATSDLFESFRLHGIQRGADWVMSQSSVGDDCGLVFTITTAGQVQYTSTNVTGFISNTLKFKATVLGV